MITIGYIMNKNVRYISIDNGSVCFRTDDKFYTAKNEKGTWKIEDDNKNVYEVGMVKTPYFNKRVARLLAA